MDTLNLPLVVWMKQVVNSDYLKLWA